VTTAKALRNAQKKVSLNPKPPANQVSFPIRTFPPAPANAWNRLSKPCPNVACLPKPCPTTASLPKSIPKLELPTTKKSFDKKFMPYADLPLFVNFACVFDALDPCRKFYFTKMFHQASTLYMQDKSTLTDFHFEHFLHVVYPVYWAMKTQLNESTYHNAGIYCLEHCAYVVTAEDEGEPVPPAELTPQAEPATPAPEQGTPFSRYTSGFL
jgi:hypothetical protein